MFSESLQGFCWQRSVRVLRNWIRYRNYWGLVLYVRLGICSGEHWRLRAVQQSTLRHRGVSRAVHGLYPECVRRLHQRDSEWGCLHWSGGAVQYECVSVGVRGGARSGGRCLRVDTPVGDGGDAVSCTVRIARYCGRDLHGDTTNERGAVRRRAARLHRGCGCRVRGGGVGGSHRVGGGGRDAQKAAGCLGAGDDCCDGPR
mmetsp:Transcript_8711/g.21571  ORF Transcript_8711/g.21571 Transcript_8711/m.21571 type:complete len:201 (+) Transcript_8711:469-1071(+)